jgi:hypothetical protein
MQPPVIQYETHRREVETEIRRRLARPQAPSHDVEATPLRRYRARRGALRAARLAGHTA